MAEATSEQLGYIRVLLRRLQLRPEEVLVELEIDREGLEDLTMDEASEVIAWLVEEAEEGELDGIV